MSTSAGLSSSVVRANNRRHRILVGIAEHSVAIVLAVAFLAPFAIIFLTAFMSQVQAGTGSLWPHPWVFTNFRDVFAAMPFWRDFANTVLYAVLACCGVVLSSTPVAYALSRLRWRGREWVFIVVLATMMIPAQVTSLPLYVMYAKIGWVGTLAPLIVPTFFGDAYSIFLLRQFFLTIPQELTEAARIDGANEFRIMMRVIIPIAKPGIAAIGLFSFLWAWNDFYNPLLYTGNSNNNQTLAVGLSQLAKSAHEQSQQMQMAAALMFAIPVIIIFFFAQKAFVEGISITGVKG